MRRFFLSVTFLAGLSFSAGAQTFDEVMSAAQSNVGDIARYQQALQNPDQRLQYALVQQMLALPDPALQRIAKEHALFSTNPVMRESAIKAILDSGATLRLQVAGAQSEKNYIEDFIRSRGGVYVGGQGAALITVPEALSEACWGSRSCMFKQVGNTIQFTPGGGITAVLTLGNDGVLRGSMEYKVNSNRDSAQAQIDLKE